MKLPGPKELIAPILKLAQEKGRLSQADIYNFIAFEFGAYEGGPAIKQPTDLWRFSAYIQEAQKQLLRDGLLEKDAGSFAITPRGEAFLANGLSKLDAGAREALANVPPKRRVPPPVPAASPTADVSDDEIGKLLDEAKIFHFDVYGFHVVPFDGDLRTWWFDVWQSGDWLCLRAHVMRVPAAPAVKGTLIEAALKVNASVSGAKFSATKDGLLVLDAEYRVEHVNSELLKNVIGMLMRLAEQRYPEFLRIVTGQQALESLEAAYKRST
jgi:hypothetical protein